MSDYLIFLIAAACFTIIMGILVAIYSPIASPEIRYPIPNYEPGYSFEFEVSNVVAKPACVGCKYYVPWRDKKSGNCHRCPPQIYDDGCGFPNVKDDEWCGDFEVKTK